MQTSFQLLASDMDLLEPYADSLQLFVLLALIGAATVFDLRERRIPNWLVAMGMLLGILLHVLTPNGAGILFALTGLGVGIMALFPFYALGLMGAGDAKLMGMIGSFLGMSGVFGVIIASMAAGGLLALGMAARKRMLPQLLANIYFLLIDRSVQKMGKSAVMDTLPSVGKMPYATAILAGTLIQLFVLRY